VQSIFSRYGQLRSIQRTFDGGECTEQREGGNSCDFTVEYFNIQDARLAASEFCATSSQLWGGTDVELVFANLDTRKQQLCRQLLAVLSRWRSELSANPGSYQRHISGQSHTFHHNPQYGVMLDVPNTLPMSVMMPGYGSQQVYSHNGSGPFGHHQLPNPYGMGSQHVLPMYPTSSAGSAYMVAHTGMHSPQHSPKTLNSANPEMTEILRNRNNLDKRVHTHPPPGSPKQYEQDISRESALKSDRPLHHNGGHGQLSKRQQRAFNENSTDSDFSLDISRIESGSDKRTTLMVRTSII